MRRVGCIICEMRGWDEQEYVEERRGEERRGEERRGVKMGDRSVKPSCFVFNR